MVEDQVLHTRPDSGQNIYPRLGRNIAQARAFGRLRHEEVARTSSIECLADRLDPQTIGIGFHNSRSPRLARQSVHGPPVVHQIAKLDGKPRGCSVESGIRGHELGGFFHRRSIQGQG